MALTGFYVIRERDMNPQSPTYLQTRERKEQSEDCQEGKPDWQSIGESCEITAEGVPTGNVIKLEQDMNPESPTYGNMRETKTMNTAQCPLQDTNASWVIDETFEDYCEQMWYEPGHVEGNTGKHIYRLIDDNVFSETYEQTQISGVTDLENCPIPDTSPKLGDEISYSCLLEADADGFLHMTGIAAVTAQDVNIYSPTYLDVVTKEQADPRCPANDIYIFEWCGSSSLTISPEGGNNTTCVKSHLNGQDTGWTASSACGWLSARYNSASVLTVSADKNTEEEERCCTVTLTQNGSGKKLTIEVCQKEGEPEPCNEFMDSPTITICGNVGEQNCGESDSISGGCRASYDYDASWLEITTDFSKSYGQVLYQAAEDNFTGKDRQCTVHWTLLDDGGNENLCEEQDVVVTQLAGEEPEPEPQECSMKSFFWRAGSIDNCGDEVLWFDYTLSDSTCDGKFTIELVRLNPDNTSTSMATSSNGYGGNGHIDVTDVEPGTYSTRIRFQGAKSAVIYEEKKVTVTECNKPCVIPDLSFGSVDNVQDCDGVVRQRCTALWSTDCNNGVVNFEFSDAAGNKSTGGFSTLSLVEKEYNFKLGTNMQQTPISVKWWNVSDPAISGSSSNVEYKEEYPTSVTVKLELHNNTTEIWSNVGEFSFNLERCGSQKTATPTFTGPSTVRTGALGTFNLTFPADCWSYSIGQFTFRASGIKYTVQYDVAYQGNYLPARSTHEWYIEKTLTVQ